LVEKLRRRWFGGAIAKLRSHDPEGAFATGLINNVAHRAGDPRGEQRRIEKAGISWARDDLYFANHTPD
jgi:hypothetical protein